MSSESGRKKVSCLCLQLSDHKSITMDRNSSDMPCRDVMTWRLSFELLPSFLIFCQNRFSFNIQYPFAFERSGNVLIFNILFRKNLYNKHKIAHIQIVKIPRMKFNHKTFFWAHCYVQVVISFPLLCNRPHPSRRG